MPSGEIEKCAAAPAQYHGDCSAEIPLLIIASSHIMFSHENTLWIIPESILALKHYWFSNV